MAQGDTLQVVQHKHGRRGFTYPARVVLTEPERVILAAEWSETVETEHFRFEPGDRSIEHYWFDRWYSIWQVHAVDGRRKGWYCNVSRPARINDSVLVSEDVELDLWAARAGAPIRLDEDEFASRAMWVEDPTAAEQARRALDLRSLASQPSTVPLESFLPVSGEGRASFFSFRLR
jgi:protein associated with RNAse G/E